MSKVVQLTHAEYYQKWGSVAQLIGAGGAIISMLVAIVAVTVASNSYHAAVVQQQNKLSADALLDWGKRQPPNTRACLDLLRKLKTEELVTIIARQRLSLSSRPDNGASLNQEALACFSDQDSVESLINNGNLLPKGASLLASRADAILESDTFIAVFLLNNIGNRDVFESIRTAICRDDVPIIENLPKDSRTMDSYVQLRHLIDIPKPKGCK